MIVLELPQCSGSYVFVFLCKKSLLAQRRGRKKGGVSHFREGLISSEKEFTVLGKEGDGDEDNSSAREVGLRGREGQPPLLTASPLRQCLFFRCGASWLWCGQRYSPRAVPWKKGARVWLVLRWRVPRGLAGSAVSLHCSFPVKLQQCSSGPSPHLLFAVFVYVRLLLAFIFKSTHILLRFVELAVFA